MLRGSCLCGTVKYEVVSKPPHLSQPFRGVPSGVGRSVRDECGGCRCKLENRLGRRISWCVRDQSGKEALLLFRVRLADLQPWTWYEGVRVACTAVRCWTIRAFARRITRTYRPLRRAGHQ